MKSPPGLFDSMHPPKPAILLATIAALTLIALALIVHDEWALASDPGGAEQFQRLVGGLGLGPVMVPSHCEFSFDPRISPDWRAAHHPVVCGEYFCPQHANSVFHLSPLDLRGEVDSEAPIDASIR